MYSRASRPSVWTRQPLFVVYRPIFPFVKKLHYASVRIVWSLSPLHNTNSCFGDEHRELKLHSCDSRIGIAEGTSNSVPADWPIFQHSIPNSPCERITASCRWQSDGLPVQTCISFSTPSLYEASAVILLIMSRQNAQCSSVWSVLITSYCSARNTLFSRLRTL